ISVSAALLPLIPARPESGRLPRFVIVTQVARLLPEDRAGRVVGLFGPGGVGTVRLLPGFRRPWPDRRRVLPCVVQPAVPFRADPARLRFAVVDHPAAGTVGVLVVDVA